MYTNYDGTKYTTYLCSACANILLGPETDTSPELIVASSDARLEAEYELAILMKIEQDL